MKHIQLAAHPSQVRYYTLFLMCRTAGNTLTKSQQVKPISAADQRTLDSAIAMANELASKSMSELDCNQESPPDSEGMPDSPITPSSPTKHAGGPRFSFK